MSLESLMKRVEERVDELLIPALFDRVSKHHTKQNWRDCSCTYCKEKRKWHSKLSFSPFGMSRVRREEWRDRTIQSCRNALQIEAEKVIS